MVLRVLYIIVVKSVFLMNAVNEHLVKMTHDERLPNSNLSATPPVSLLCNIRFLAYLSLSSEHRSLSVSYTS